MANIRSNGELRNKIREMFKATVETTFDQSIPFANNDMRTQAIDTFLQAFDHVAEMTPSVPLEECSVRAIEEGRAILKQIYGSEDDLKTEIDQLTSEINDIMSRECVREDIAEFTGESAWVTGIRSRASKK